MFADKWIESATLITQYLPNFLYISAEWLLANLGKIFDQNNYQKWLCAIQGYSYVQQISKNVYEYLKEHGDFVKALDDSNLNDSVKEYVIHSIVFFYLKGYEDLFSKNSLLLMLLQRKNIKEMRALSYSGHMLQKEEDKLLSLLENFISHINFDKCEERKLASALCTWIEYINTFNKSTLSLIFKIVPFADEEYNSARVIEKLADLSETQPVVAADIWIKMLSRTTPSFSKDKIAVLLKNIHNARREGEDKIKVINEIYLKRGSDMVHRMLES